MITFNLRDPRILEHYEMARLLQANGFNDEEIQKIYDRQLEKDGVLERGQPMKLNDLAKEVHQNAVDHGWWEEERTFGEIVALCHSELSEALEEFRAGRPMLWHETWRNSNGESFVANDKPEGIAVELADCIIRILDWFGKEGANVDNALFLVGEVGPIPNTCVPFGALIAELHKLLTMAYISRQDSCDGLVYVHMAGCIGTILRWAKENDVDMEAILALKHSYNKGRPYRHGGKVL